MIDIRVPASTSNLGSGFDVLGLALKLYLRVTAESAEKTTIETSGEGSDELPAGPDNLIWRVAQFVADKEDVRLPAIKLKLENQIPVSRGLGSSAAAIVAGIKLFEAISKRSLGTEQELFYALEFEPHADNLGPALLGGLVINCVSSDRQAITLKLDWPSQIKVIVVVPDMQLSTAAARAVLPARIDRSNAIFNLQRVAMFVAALQQGRVDLIREATRDRLHQPAREPLISGLAEALNLPHIEGFYGATLSGAGPTILALVDSNLSGIDEKIGSLIVDGFRRHGIKSKALSLEIDSDGCIVEGSL
ncbi:MAG TPA: homoserine kinase [Blastocatellia bacterium]|nr:homoserine kinase [Blastocatellia bacterium]